MRKPGPSMLSQPKTRKGRAAKARIVGAAIVGGRHVPRRYRANEARRARLNARAAVLLCRFKNSFPRVARFWHDLRPSTPCGESPKRPTPPGFADVDFAEVEARVLGFHPALAVLDADLNKG